MRWLVGLVWVMGVLIVLGVATVAVTVLHRMGGPSHASLASLALNEPAGTRIAGIALAGDRLAVSLSGGGPDRVAIVDLRGGGTVARISLSH
jgi:hypothetical protein